MNYEKNLRAANNSHNYEYKILTKTDKYIFGEHKENENEYIYFCETIVSQPKNIIAKYIENVIRYDQIQKKLILDVKPMSDKNNYAFKIHNNLTKKLGKYIEFNLLFRKINNNRFFFTSNKFNKSNFEMTIMQYVDFIDINLKCLNYDKTKIIVFCKIQPVSILPINVSLNQIKIFVQKFIINCHKFFNKKKYDLSLIKSNSLKLFFLNNPIV